MAIPLASLEGDRHRFSQTQIAFGQPQLERLAQRALIQVQVFVDHGAEIQLDIFVARLNDTGLRHQRAVHIQIVRRSHHAARAQ